MEKLPQVLSTKNSSSAGNIFKVLFYLLIVFAIAVLGFSVFNISKRVDYIAPDNVQTGKTSETSTNTPETPQDKSITDTLNEFRKEVDTKISQAVATISSKTSKATQNVTTNTSLTGGVTYIPFGESYTTTSTSWYTVDDSAVYVDLISEYPKGSIVSFEASLKVEHANGQAYARVWDDTNKVAVNGSEISTTNNSELKLVSTGNLALWNGRNLYKIQIKSLNSFVITIVNPKLKIRY